VVNVDTENHHKGTEDTEDARDSVLNRALPLEWRAVTPSSMNEANRKPETYLDDETSEGSVRLQIVRSGSRYFGIPTENISTIVGWHEPTPLPDAPQSVLGVVSIEGRMLTVLDLARLTAGKADGNDAAREEHIVALRGDEQLALAVNEVNEVIESGLAESNMQRQMPLVSKAFHHKNREIEILSLKELFPTAIQGRERRRRRF
jgi:chemotaxis signal transduction protein